MQNRRWLKVIGILELIGAGIISVLILLLLIALIGTKDDSSHHGEGKAYITLGLFILIPIALFLFAIGMMAVRQHKYAIYVQLGVGLAFLGLITPILIN